MQVHHPFSHKYNKKINLPIKVKHDFTPYEMNDDVKLDVQPVVVEVDVRA